MGTVKTYRIIHNPYNFHTKLIPIYEGSTTVEEDLSDADCFRDILRCGHPMPIQSIGYALLERIDEQEQKSNRPFRVEFQGIERDQKDFDHICKVYDKNHPDRFTWSFRKSGVPTPAQVRKQLGDICASIASIYSDDTKVSARLNKCRTISEHKLNVLIAGMQNSGKSTLLNALFGINLLPTSSDIETATVYEICNGEKAKIVVKAPDGDAKEICFPYEFCDSADSWFSPLMSRQKYEDQMLKAIHAQDLYAQMRCALCAINSHIKEQQEEKQSSSNLGFVSQITIYVPNLRILGLGTNYHFWDLPGEGAVHLKEEHKALINQMCSNVETAILVYVCNIDAFLHEAPRKALNGMEQYQQIDYLRSIYVLNKADGEEDFDTLLQKIPADKTFRYRKIIFTCGSVALSARARRKSDRTLQLFQDSADCGPGLSLPEKACLPKGTDLEKLYNVSQQFPVLESLPEKFQTILLRSGLPLLAALIEDYSQHMFDLKQISDIKSEIRNMVQEIVSEQDKRLATQQAKKESLENTRNEIRAELEQKLTESIAEMARRENQGRELATKSLAGIIEEYQKKSEELIKQEFKTGLKGKKQKIANIQNALNKQIASDWLSIQKRIESGLVKTCDQAKEELCKAMAITHTALTNHDLDGIRSSIRSVQIDSETIAIKAPDIRTSPLDFLFRKHFESKVAKTFNNKIRECFNTVAEKYAIPLDKKIKKFLEDLQSTVKRKIDDLNPELKKQNRELAKATRDFEDLIRRKEALDEQWKRAEEIQLQMQGE